jgi:SHS2 domain-containing protein
MRYETIDHTADTGIVAYGETIEALFENAAFGMFDLMFDVERLAPLTHADVIVEGGDLPGLLYAWLSELLYRFEADEMAWCRFDVAIEHGQVRARVGGGPVPELTGPPIKAVTLHGLDVVRDEREWAATVVFDV